MVGGKKVNHGGGYMPIELLCLALTMPEAAVAVVLALGRPHWRSDDAFGNFLFGACWLLDHRAQIINTLPGALSVAHGC